MKSYHVGETKGIIDFIATVIAAAKTPIDVEKISDPAYLRAIVANRFPALRDKTRCPNCTASMEEYMFTFDAFCAGLLISMAQCVRDRQRKSMLFTDANKVRVPDLDTSHTVKCRTTQASKLGLVAQARNREGRRIAGTWLITSRGWSALAGAPVPKHVIVWRDQIQDRLEQTTTIKDALRNFGRGRSKNKDTFLETEREYDPSQWIEYVGVHEATLL